MDQATSHHVGMKFTQHPDGRTEVEVHKMPSAGPAMGSGMPAQGMVADPMAAGAKGAMDQALAPAAPANAGGGNSPMGQAKQFGGELGSETGRPKAKAAAPSAGNQPKPKDKAGTPKAKPTGKLPAKSSEKSKAKKP